MWAKGQVRGAVCEWDWGSGRDMGKGYAERKGVQHLDTRGRMRAGSNFELWRGTEAHRCKVRT